MLYMKQVQKGFTLIELMIVIAIVAILVALAVPAYQDYTIRSKVGECVNNGAVAKLSISEYRETTGAWPATAPLAGLGGAAAVGTAGESQYCNPFELSGTEGAFEISANIGEIDTAITGEITPLMTPTVHATSQNIDWICSVNTTTAVNVKYLPASCRGTATTP